MSVTIPKVNDKAIKILQEYHWPGNVRQLQNVIQRMLFACEGEIDYLHVEDALGSRKGGRVNKLEDDFKEIITWKEMETSLKRKYFLYVRSKTKSDSDAARKLGLAPSNYYRTCRDLGIK